LEGAALVSYVSRLEAAEGMKWKRWISAWLPVLLWCGLIFYLSGVPYLRITQAWYDIILRKIAHLGEYAILVRLIVRALTSTTLWAWKTVFAAALVLTILYASTDEYHQTFVAGRVGCVHDILIDTAGAWLGLGIIP
jgi:VanZ family protein